MAVDKYQIKVIENAIDIVEILSKSDIPLKIADISKEIKLTYNQVFRILQTLKIKNWVLQEGDSYTLGDGVWKVWARVEKRIGKQIIELKKKWEELH